VLNKDPLAELFSINSLSPLSALAGNTESSTPTPSVGGTINSYQNFLLSLANRNNLRRPYSTTSVQTESTTSRTLVNGFLVGSKYNKPKQTTTPGKNPSITDLES